MKILFKFTYLFLLLTLNISCLDKEKSEFELNKTNLENISKSDALKFSTGIQCIFQDSRGEYWFGIKNVGVSKFDGKTVEYFSVDNGLSDNHIRSIQEDKNGIVWFRTAKGINSYDGKKIADYNLITDIESKNEWGKKENDLWFSAGNRAGVYRYDGKKMNYLEFPNPKIINPNNVYFVTSIVEGQNDMLWIGTYAGIFGYNGKSFDVINDETLNLDISYNPLHIRSLFEDSKGRLWIGNNGIGVLLKDKDSIINFSEKKNLVHPTSTRKGDKSEPGTLEHVFAIEEDGEGNIWFGDRDTGIWKYDGNTMKNYSIELEQSESFVHTIYKDKNDDLWFLFTNGTVFTYNGKTFDKKFNFAH